MTLSAVVIEDQAVARAHLRDLLARIDGVEWVGEAVDGDAALRLLADKRPDLAFLDIEIPGPSGLEVLRRADPRPAAVFTTAYDRHAVTAFELQALDYLLKPFGIERLRAAIERARQHAGRAAVDQVARAEAALEADGPLRRVFVRTRSRIVPVELDRVARVHAQGDYVELLDGERTHLVRVPLSRFVARLDPAKFIRIHRSHVINLDHVAEFVALDDGRLEVVLVGGERLIASRRRTAALRARLDPGA